MIAYNKKQFIKISDNQVINLIQQTNKHIVKKYTKVQFIDFRWAGEALTISNIDEIFSEADGEEEDENCVIYINDQPTTIFINHKPVNCKQLYKFYKRGIKEAKTLAELNNLYNNVKVIGYKVIQQDNKFLIEEKRIAETDEELLKMINDNFTYYEYENNFVFDTENKKN